MLQVYSATTQPLIQKVVGGFNSTVFAYGQTSSGKTHTMRGTEQEPGIIPLAVREIFDHIGSMQDREFLLRVSYMEVCNPSASSSSCACHEAGLKSQSLAEVQNRPCAAQSMQPPSLRGCVHRRVGIRPAACAAMGPGCATRDRHIWPMVHARGCFVSFPSAVCTSDISLTLPPAQCRPALLPSPLLPAGPSQEAASSNVKVATQTAARLHRTYCQTWSSACLQIYNEEVHDLLSSEQTKLQIHENKDIGIYGAGLREDIVTSAEHVLQLLGEGEKMRHFGETKMNKTSSRSHTIFRMVRQAYLAAIMAPLCE